MDGSGNRENGRHKPDQYRPVQWIMPQHQMKDHHTAHAVKIMAAIAERDSALHERDLALSEKRTAQAERDMAIFQRDAAITERNNAILERDNAISALEYTRGNGINGGNNGHNHHTMNNSSSPQSSDSPYNQKRETHVPKREPKAESVVTSKRAPKSEKKRSKKRGESVGEDLNKQVTVAQMHGEWRGEDVKPPKKHRKEWKLEDLGGLNEVVFDESTMPVPVCSCTGRYQPCYKWGNGGWQSACCTTTLSMYPLPMMPNKRHARVNGRKMSGSVFTKLLSRLAAEGHDLSVPLDLKDHWSKHGTNRYITIK